MAQLTVRLPGSRRSFSLSTKGAAYPVLARETLALSQATAVPGNGMSADVVFGPGQAMPSHPLDRSGLARLDNYRPGWNITPRPGEGRIDYDLIKQLSDSYDVLRKAIEIRKTELCVLPWDITIKGAKHANQRELLARLQPNIDRVKARFSRPDLRNTYQSWLRKGLEDLFVGDYLSLSTIRSLGGDVIAWRFIDGATIKCDIDIVGEIPLRPSVAYKQILYGIPRFDFFEADDPMSYEEALAYWERSEDHTPTVLVSPGELRYRPLVRRNKTPYGFSAVEMFAVHINNALRHQLWEGAFWTDGNIPSALIAAPDTWTADQLEEYQALWDAMISGDPGKQRSIRWIPGGSQLQNIENALDHSKDFADFLIDMTCFCMDVTREEIGLDRSAASGGDKKIDLLDRHAERISLRPTALWLKGEIFDPIIQHDLEETELEWVWPSLVAENERDRAEVNQILIMSGQKSIDEIVSENGGVPPGIGRILATGAQVFFERDMVRGTEEGVAALAAATPSYQATQPAQHIEPGDHSGDAPQPDNSAPAGGVPHGKGGDPVREDLRRWRTKALKAVKSGKTAQVSFETTHLTEFARSVMDFRLAQAMTPEEVREVFDRALEEN